MLSITYDDWKCVCNQVFSESDSRKKIYLQWFPFARLSSSEKKMLKSKEYFDNYIKNGVFTFYPENWIVADNYLLKGDGNFRNATLISPIMYMLSLCIGKNIARQYKTNRPDEISVFYAGNYLKNRLY